MSLRGSDHPWSLSGAMYCRVPTTSPLCVRSSLPSALASPKSVIQTAPDASRSKFEGLMETLEILADEKAMKSIRKSIKEARNEKWLDFDEVFVE